MRAISTRPAPETTAGAPGTASSAPSGSAAPVARFFWPESPAAFDALAADQVAAALLKRDAALALPTGRTPLGLYAHLRARAAAGEISFRRARVFDLDEYVGLSATHPLSYARYMHTELLDPVGASPHNVRLLRGDAPDLAVECGAYEEAIARAGGIDLAILGLGENGHIAFNEPGTPWDSRTHVAQLSDRTREVNHSADGTAIPERGLTMGIATIRQARAILLLVAGTAKQAALAALRRGVPDPRWPVTSLIGHADVTVICEARVREA